MPVALANPITPGKEGAWKGFMKELGGPRREEFDDLNARSGLDRHEAYLQVNPDGSCLSIVFMEGPGEAGFEAKLSTSDHPFDVWFKSRLQEIHSIDPNAGPPDLPERWLG